MLEQKELLLVYTTQSPRRPGLYPVRTILARPLLDPVYILGMFSATTDALPSVCIEECLFLAAKGTEETHCYQSTYLKLLACSILSNYLDCSSIV